MLTPFPGRRAPLVGLALSVLTAGTLAGGQPVLAEERSGPAPVTSLRTAVERGGDLAELPRGETRRAPADAAPLRSAAVAPARASLTAARVSTFTIRFVDTPGNAWTPAARAAFRAAADVWERTVESRVPIVVEATARSLGPGLLGGAGPYDFLRNEGRTPLPTTRPATAADLRDDVFEPVALFNARTGRDALPPARGELNPDIVADFNPNLPGLYLGTDARPGPDQVDFRTVVLHEIGHGLGLTGTAAVVGTRATVGVSDINGSTGVRSGVSFDQFTYATSAAEAGTGGRRVLSLPDGSSALRTALTGGQLYWAGQQAITAAGGPVRLHAPSLCGEQGPARACGRGESAFVEGTSYSHLDELRYPRSSPDGLMTPYLDEGEAYLDPGQVALGLLADMGYAVPALTGSRYSAVGPVRVLDTRTGTGARAGVVRPGSLLDLTVAGVRGVPADARAVVLNLTGLAPASPSDVRAYPSPVTSSPVPAVSHLSLTPGVTRANLVTVQVGRAGRVRLHNGAGSAHLQADLVGWYSPTAASAFTAAAPVRLLDTRTGQGAPRASLGPGALLDLPVRAPAGTTAVALTVTALGATRPTEVRAYPGGGDPAAVPGTSSLSVPGSAPVTNLVLAGLGPDGTVRLRNAAGRVHLVADLVGTYGPAGELFRPVTPRRVLDTRSRLGTGPATPRRLGPGASVGVTVGGATTIPRLAGSAVLSLTGVAPSTRTDLRLVPGAPAAPPAFAQLSVSPGGATAGQVIARLSGGRTTVRNSAGSIAVVADAVGWFGPAA